MSDLVENPEDRFSHITAHLSMNPILKLHFSLIMALLILVLEHIGSMLEFGYGT